MRSNKTRYQHLVFRTIPDSVLEWLDGELEKRNIDCVYTHFILSILQEDDINADLEESIDDSHKVYRKLEKLYSAAKNQKWKKYSKHILLSSIIPSIDVSSPNCELKKKKAAITCLKAVSDDNTIEELIDEVCMKLKNLRNSIAKEKKESHSHTDGNIKETPFYIPPSSPTDQVEKYFAAFPPLNKKVEDNNSHQKAHFSVCYANCIRQNISKVQDNSIKSNSLQNSVNTKKKQDSHFGCMKSFENICQLDNKKMSKNRLSNKHNHNTTNLKVTDENGYCNLSSKMAAKCDNNSSVITTNSTRSIDPSLPNYIEKSSSKIARSKICVLKMKGGINFKKILHSFLKVNSIEGNKILSHQSKIESCDITNNEPTGDKKVVSNDINDSSQVNLYFPLDSKSVVKDFNFAPTNINSIIIGNSAYYKFNVFKALKYFSPHDIFNIITTGDNNEVSNFLSKFSIQSNFNLCHSSNTLAFSKGMVVSESIPSFPIEIAKQQQEIANHPECFFDKEYGKFMIEYDDLQTSAFFCYETEFQQMSKILTPYGNVIYTCRDMGQNLPFCDLNENLLNEYDINAATSEELSNLRCGSSIWDPAVNETKKSDAEWFLSSCRNNSKKNNFSCLEADDDISSESLSFFSSNSAFRPIQKKEMPSIHNNLVRTQRNLVKKTLNIDRIIMKINAKSRIDSLLSAQHTKPELPIDNSPQTFCHSFDNPYNSIYSNGNRFDGFISFNSGTAENVPSTNFDLVNFDWSKKSTDTDENLKAIWENKNHPMHVNENNFEVVEENNYKIIDENNHESIDSILSAQYTCPELPIDNSPQTCHSFDNPYNLICSNGINLDGFTSFNCGLAENVPSTKFDLVNLDWSKKITDTDENLEAIWENKNHPMHINENNFEVVVENNYKIIDENNYEVVDESNYEAPDENNYEVIDKNNYEAVDENNYEARDSLLRAQHICPELPFDNSIKTFCHSFDNSYNLIYRNGIILDGFTSFDSGIAENVPSTNFDLVNLSWSKKSTNSDLETLQNVKQEDELFETTYSISDNKEENLEKDVAKLTIKNSYILNTGSKNETLEMNVEEIPGNLVPKLDIESKATSKVLNSCTSDFSVPVSDVGTVNVFSINNYMNIVDSEVTCSDNSYNFGVKEANQNFCFNDVSAFRVSYESVYSKNKASYSEADGLSLDSSDITLESDVFYYPTSNIHELESTGAEISNYEHFNPHNVFKDSEIAQVNTLPSTSRRVKNKFLIYKKPCVLYMEGNCNQQDCKYSHDLRNITCRFWVQGSCFKGSTCPFLHGYVEHHSTDQPSEPLNRFSLDSEVDFPPLSSNNCEKNAEIKSSSVDIIHAKSFTKSQNAKK